MRELSLASAAVVLSALAAAAVVGLAQPGCAKVASGGGDGGASPAGPPILLGASVGITGGLSGNTRAFEGALKVATQQINAAGGILGREVQFVIQDDMSDPTAAPTVANALIGMGVPGVIGPGASSEVTVDIPIFTQHQVVDLSASATSILLTQNQTNKQGWFFRTVPNDSYQGKAVVKFAQRGPNAEGGAPGCTKMAIVYNADAYGMPMDGIIEPAFKLAGGVITYSTSVPATTAASYQTQAQLIVNSANPPDCLTMVVFAPTGAQLVSDVKAAIALTPAGVGPNFFIIGTDGCYDPTFITDGQATPTSKSVVEGVYGTNADSAPATKEYGYLQSAYIQTVGLQTNQPDLDPYTSNEYDAAILLALAVEQAGSVTNPTAIQQAMFNVSRGMNPSSAKVFDPSQIPEALAAIQQGQDINYNGASGTVDFTDSGDVVGGFIVWKVENGQFVTYDHVTEQQLAN